MSYEEHKIMAKTIYLVTAMDLPHLGEVHDTYETYADAEAAYDRYMKVGASEVQIYVCTMIAEARVISLKVADREKPE